MAVTEVSASLRTTAPYSAVGVMFVYWPDGTASLGTASVVGRNDILTATHMVYSPDHGGWATGFDFYFGADYNNTLDRFDSSTCSYTLRSGSFTWQVKAFPSNVFTDSQASLLTYGESQYDVAMIGVSKAVGDATGWFAVDPGRDVTQTATQVGYPTTGTGMMAGTLSVMHDSYYGLYSATTDAMGPGSSGGPLITADGVVVAVKSAGSGSLSMWADVGSVWSALSQFMASDETLLGVTAPAAPAPAPAPDAAPAPQYALSAAAASVNEGATASFTFMTANVAAGTLLGYQLTGVQASDVVGGALTGAAMVGADGRATVSIGLVSDQLTEGTERLTISGYGASASMLVNDTSVALPVQEVKAALGIYRAFYGAAPTDAAFSGIVSFVTTSTAQAYAASVASSFGGEASGLLASRVLQDVSIGPSTLGGGNPVASYGALQDALGQLFDIYAGERGQVVLRLTSLLGGLEGNEVFGAAAARFNAGVAGDYVALSAPAGANSIEVSLLGMAEDLNTLTHLFS
jgi:V8-like Glu-specific endopeptidase